MHYDTEIFKRAVEKYIIENKPDVDTEDSKFIIDSIEITNNMLNEFSEKYPFYTNIIEDGTIIDRFNYVTTIIVNNDIIPFNLSDWNSIYLYILIEAGDKDSNNIHSLERTLKQSCIELNKINEKVRTKVKNMYQLPSFTGFTKGTKELNDLINKKDYGNKIINFPPSGDDN